MNVETLAIPTSLRRAVDDRDGTACRFCGIYLGERRVIHHIHYGGDAVGTGGRRKHALDNLITLCGPADNDCHGAVHADKRTWQHVMAALIHLPGTTALQYQRWTKGPRP